MIIGSFYTNETYAKEAERMRISAGQFSLQVDVRAVPDQGSWWANVSLKPQFALRMMDAHKGQDLLLLDTDAIFWKAPTELLHPQFPEDVALFIAANNKPSSGTMFFRNNSKSRIFLRAWDKLIKDLAEDGVDNREYEALVKMTAKPRVTPIHILGPEYFWVERIMRRKYPSADPVIEHFMISKEGK